MAANSNGHFSFLKMNLSLKIGLIIFGISLVIIVVGLAIGSQFIASNVQYAIESDMLVAVDIADKYVTREIDLIKVMAAEAAGNIRLLYDTAPSINEALELVCADYPMFTGLAVFENTALVGCFGDANVPPDLINEPFMQTAVKGGQELSTTMHCLDGALVMYVSSLVKEGITLAAVLPGLYFRDIIAQFTFWESGHLFIDDEEGTIIANIRAEWVEQRINYIKMAETNPGYEEIAEVLRLALSGEHGVGQFSINGVPRICAYRPLSTREEDWIIGLIAPLNETVLVQIPLGIIMIGSITLFLSIAVTIPSANYLKRPYMEAQAALAAKSAFLANMSHEMRTPLTAVIGLTELTLKTAKLDEAASSNLIKVYRAGETLLLLINDILDISKIDADKFTLNPKEYDVPSMLNDTITQSIMYIESKPVQFVLDIQEDLPACLYGDELRVKQILNNLLSNAFKFTKEGTVELGIRHEKENGSLWLTAWVRDTGIGIRKEDIGKLFTTYSKMDEDVGRRSVSRRTEGTGLGLSISQKAASMMGGSITVQSEYGKGSVFTVRIKQNYVNDSKIGKTVVENLKKFNYTFSKFKKANVSRVNLSYARVLVVDDNTINLDVAKGIMSLYGMKIDCVTSGKAAIDAIREEKFKYNAIFMDHMMPEMDGIQAANLIREIGTDYAKNIPIIALTANAVLGNEEMFIRCGFQGFIAKPIDLNALDNVLRQWVRDKDAEAMLADKWINADDVLADENQITDIPGLDVEKGRAHFIKEEVYINVLTSFAKNTKPLLESIKDANADTLSEYSVVVHGIKGAARGIYAEEASDLAEALETAANKGDIDYVRANNQRFIDIVNNLIYNIEDAVNKGVKKPAKYKPDAALLAKFLSACGSYDIDQMDALMAEMELYEYTDDDGLVSWLREKLNQGMYKDIKERLENSK